MSSKLLVIVGCLDDEDRIKKIVKNVGAGIERWIEPRPLEEQEELVQTLNSIPSMKSIPNRNADDGAVVSRYRGRILDTTVLINPSSESLHNELVDLFLTAPSRCLIVFGGFVTEDNADWLLQDGKFSLCDFGEIFSDSKVTAALSEHNAKVTVACCNRGSWQTTEGVFDPHSKISFEVMDYQSLPAHSQTSGGDNLNDALIEKQSEVEGFTSFLEDGIGNEIRGIFSALKPPHQEGFLKIRKPCLYVFPGGNGDSAFFAVNGFNMLVNGGTCNRPWFWKLIQHVDRVDSVLASHLGCDNLPGLNSLLLRKLQERQVKLPMDNTTPEYQDLRRCLISPDLGPLFMNTPAKFLEELNNNGTASGSQQAVGNADFPSAEDNLPSHHQVLKTVHVVKDTLRLTKALNMMMVPLVRKLGSNEPLTLFSKVGLGRLELYVLNPLEGSKELTYINEKWGCKGKTTTPTGKTGVLDSSGTEGDSSITNLSSICALLVWHPSDPDEKIVRVLFPGNASQTKIFEGMETLKNLPFMKMQYATKNLISKQKQTSKPNGMHPSQKTARPTSAVAGARKPPVAAPKKTVPVSGGMPSKKETTATNKVNEKKPKADRPAGAKASKALVTKDRAASSKSPKASDAAVEKAMPKPASGKKPTAARPTSAAAALSKPEFTKRAAATSSAKAPSAKAKQNALTKPTEKTKKPQTLAPAKSKADGVKTTSKKPLKTAAKNAAPKGSAEKEKAVKRLKKPAAPVVTAITPPEDLTADFAKLDSEKEKVSKPVEPLSIGSEEATTSVLSDRHSPEGEDGFMDQYAEALSQNEVVEKPEQSKRDGEQREVAESSDGGYIIVSKPDASENEDQQIVPPEITLTKTPLDEGATTVPLEEGSTTVPCGDDLETGPHKGVTMEEVPICVSNEEVPMAVPREEVQMGVSQVEDPMHVSHEEDPICVSHEEVPMAVPREEVQVGVSHEEDQIGVSHVEDPIHVSHEEVPMTVPHEEVQAGVSHEEDQICVSHEGDLICVSHEEVPMAVPREEVQMGVAHEEDLICVSHEEVPMIVSPEEVPMAAPREEVQMGVSHEDDPICVSHEEVPMAAPREEVQMAAPREEVQMGVSHEDDPICVSPEEVPMAAPREEVQMGVSHVEDPMHVSHEEEPTTALPEGAPTIASQQNAEEEFTFQNDYAQSQQQEEELQRAEKMIKFQEDEGDDSTHRAVERLPTPFHSLQDSSATSETSPISETGSGVQAAEVETDKLGFEDEAISEHADYDDGDEVILKKAAGIVEEALAPSATSPTEAYFQHDEQEQTPQEMPAEIEASDAQTENSFNEPMRETESDVHSPCNSSVEGSYELNQTRPSPPPVSAQETIAETISDFKRDELAAVEDLEDPSTCFDAQTQQVELLEDPTVSTDAHDPRYSMSTTSTGSQFARMDPPFSPREQSVATQLETDEIRDEMPEADRLDEPVEIKQERKESFEEKYLQQDKDYDQDESGEPEGFKPEPEAESYPYQVLKADEKDDNIEAVERNNFDDLHASRHEEKEEMELDASFKENAVVENFAVGEAEKDDRLIDLAEEFVGNRQEAIGDMEQEHDPMAGSVASSAQDQAPDDDSEATSPLTETADASDDNQLRAGLYDDGPNIEDYEQVESGTISKSDLSLPSPEEQFALHSGEVGTKNLIHDEYVPVGDNPFGSVAAVQQPDDIWQLRGDCPQAAPRRYHPAYADPTAPLADTSEVLTDIEQLKAAELDSPLDVNAKPFTPKRSVPASQPLSYEAEPPFAQGDIFCGADGDGLPDVAAAPTLPQTSSSNPFMMELMANSQLDSFNHDTPPEPPVRSQDPCAAQDKTSKGTAKKTGQGSATGRKVAGLSSPVYVDLAYVPNHGNKNSVGVDFFKKIRAKYYVISGNDQSRDEPSADVFNHLLEGKKSWFSEAGTASDQNDTNVTVIPTHDTPTVRGWYKQNFKELESSNIHMVASGSKVMVQVESIEACKIEF